MSEDVSLRMMRRSIIAQGNEAQFPALFPNFVAGDVFSGDDQEIVMSSDTHGELLSNTVPAEIVTNADAPPVIEISGLIEHEVVLNTSSCSILCNPKELIEQDGILVLALDAKKKSAFTLRPNINLSLHYLDAEKNMVNEPVYFGGIVFSHSDLQFLVFHLGSRE